MICFQYEHVFGDIEIIYILLYHPNQFDLFPVLSR